MQRYTKKWAREYLEKSDKKWKYIAQDEDGMVVLFKSNPKKKDTVWGNMWVVRGGRFWGNYDRINDYKKIDEMLKYSGGWENSKVTREKYETK